MLIKAIQEIGNIKEKTYKKMCVMQSIGHSLYVKLWKSIINISNLLIVNKNVLIKSTILEIKHFFEIHFSILGIHFLVQYS